MLRTVIFHTLLIPATLFFGTAVILGGLDKSGAASNFFFRKWSEFIVLISGMQIHADLSELDDENDLLFVNHQSNLDIPLVLHIMGKRRIAFLAKDQLFKVPVFGKAMRVVHCVSIDRGNPRSSMKSIQKVVESVKAGHTFVVFPEGTRQTSYDDLGDFLIGGAVAALKCGKPVTPILHYGSGRILPKGNLRLRPGPVHVKALPKFDVSEYSVKERERFITDIREYMRKAYAELRDKAEREGDHA